MFYRRRWVLEEEGLFGPSSSYNMYFTFCRNQYFTWFCNICCSYVGFDDMGYLGTGGVVEEMRGVQYGYVMRPGENMVCVVDIAVGGV